MISPVEITAPVQRLLDRIGSPFVHEIIPVKPEAGAKKGESVANVGQKAGGNLVTGWAVWLDEFICEAVPHAVWEDEHGDLVDVTPPRVPVTELLFVPDDRKLSGAIRVSVTDNPLADHLMLLADMREYVAGFATRVNEDEINFNTYTGNVYNHYDALFNNLQIFLANGGKIGSPCYCGSLKPYSQCHGKNLKAAMEEDRKAVAKVNAD